VKRRKKSFLLVAVSFLSFPSMLFGLRLVWGMGDETFSMSEKNRYPYFLLNWGTTDSYLLLLLLRSSPPSNRRQGKEGKGEKKELEEDGKKMKKRREKR